MGYGFSRCKPIGTKIGTNTDGLPQQACLAFPAYWIPTAAFIGALVGAAVVYALAWKGGIAPMRLVLAGVAVSSLLSAGTYRFLLPLSAVSTS